MTATGVRASRARLLILVALGAAFPDAARAASCGQDATQYDLNQCAADELAKADAALNKDYDEIAGRLKGNADARKRLLVAQKAWLAFRDAECAFTTADARDGSIYPLVIDGCRSTLTKARAKMLDGYLNCGEGDSGCPVPPK